MQVNHGARTGQAGILTAIAMAFLGAIGLTLGKEALVLSALTMPVPLVLLWLAADVTRADERPTVPKQARLAPLTSH